MASSSRVALLESETLSGHFLLQTETLHGAGNGACQRLGAGGTFHQVIHDAELHGLDRDLLAADGGEHNDGAGEMLRPPVRCRIMVRPSISGRLKSRSRQSG